MTTGRWRRIEDLYHAALELATSAREGLLRHACGGDDDLRREVESLLAQNTDAIVLNHGLGGIAAAMLGPGRRFTPGSMLGPYRIVDRLGSGGMGEVYRATDTRLPRDVALKVLAAGSLADPERKNRFLSEARAIAALNHPHIVTFHDLLSEGNENVLVLEYIAGTTLDRILERRKPALADALGYAIQTADALAAAHQAGIVHRDLKPANIIVSYGGAVKLLDFGLAKFTDMEVRSEPTPAATVDGGIVGTVAYMSPEQAEGRKIDLRSDIFSFGVVLLEMLTGRNAFRRDTSASTLAAVIHDEPTPAEGLPAGLEALLGRCLRKDRAKRAQSMADIKVVLEEIRDAVGSDAANPRPVLDRNSLWMRVLLALSVLALSGLWTIDRRGAEAVARTVYMEVHPPSGTTFAAISNGQFDISPDGSKLLFVAGPKGGRQQLWIQRLDKRQAESLAGTEEARFPFWSPDSRRLAFWAAGKLWRVEPGKGAAEPICDSSLPVWGGTWNRDDVIVFSENGKPLQRVPAAGGTPVAVLPLDRSRNEVEQRFPWFLPDGKHFLYTSTAEHPAKAIGSLSGESKLLQLEGTSSAQFVGPASSGYLIFQHGSKDNPSQPWYASTVSLMAQAFDAEKVRKTGVPVVVEEPVAPGRSFSISENGVLAYRRFKPLQAQLVWIDRTGIRRATVGDPFRPASGLALSPDGMIASARYSGDESDIWVTDGTNGGSSRFTFERGVNAFPAWSVDGNFMAWVFTREGKSILMRRHARGLGKEDALLSTDIKPESWSADGRWIAGTRYGVGFLDVWLVPVDSTGGAREPIPFVSRKVAGALYAQPQFSPDGRWIAYASNESGKTTESGKWQIYVQSVPEAVSGSAVAVGKWQVSDAGGTTARWRADGKELFYLAGRRIMAVDIAFSGGALFTSKPRELFEAPFYPYDINLMAYAVTPDGRRFLVPTLAEGEDPGATPISVIVNWRFRDK